MEYYKFQWLVNEKRIFMPTPSCLGDNYEGCIPQGQKFLWKKHLEEGATEEKLIIETNIDKMEKFIARSRSNYFVSC